MTIPTAVAVTVSGTVAYVAFMLFVAKMMSWKWHPDGFWQPEKPGQCWVCGMPTEWALLDQAYQHPDCDAYPSPEGDVVIIRGKRQKGGIG